MSRRKGTSRDRAAKWEYSAVKPDRALDASKRGSDVPTGFVTREEFNRLYAQVNGDGQPGIKQILEAHGTQLSIILGAQQERAKVDAFRWRSMTLILGILTLLLGLLVYLEGNHQKNSGELQWPQKSSSQPAGPVYAHYQKAPKTSDSGPDRAY
jgi:hypothetical protein